MESLSREERRIIFRNELYLLKEGEYISTNIYQKVLRSHHTFYEDLNKKEQAIEKTTVVHKPVKATTHKKVKEKKKLTPEQVRERNITWLLNSGVILVLISGLFVATSNWEVMSDWMKAGSIAVISFLFFGIGVFATRVLKIDKTAFAFMVLGSLFLPIFLLSIGWFQLVGQYLSIFGQGRYIFGILSSLSVLPVYILLARKLSSRLFVWFSYISLTSAAAFLFLSFELGIDSFYLGMMIYNTILIIVYHRLKGKANVQLFTREFISFAQINLVLTTLLMLIFFESNLFFGFNLLLTGVIYLSMVYVTGKKEFHFIFSGMLVYGVYQLVEFSLLEALSPIIYAAIGFIFLFIPKALNDDYPWKKIFELTSGVVSGAAFLFITVEGLLLKAGDPSFILLFAYVIIAANFLYLSNMTKKLLFVYLAPFFLSVALLEGAMLLDEAFQFESYILLIFLIGFTMYALFGVWMKVSYFKVVKESSKQVGWVYMLLSVFVAYLSSAWWELGVMLLLLSVCSYISLKIETQVLLKLIAEWLTPISLGLSAVAIAEEVRQFSSFYQEELGMAANFILGSVILLFTYFLLKNLIIKRKSFYVSQALYTIGLFYSLTFPMNEVWVRPLVFVGGISMYYSLYILTKIKWFPYLVGITTLFAYFNVLNSIHLLLKDNTFFDNIQFVVGGVLLLAYAFYLRKKDPVLAQGFSVVGHVYMPLALLFTFFVYGEKSIWSFLIGIIVYVISTLVATKEWEIMFFLYSAFTSIFMAFSTGSLTFERIDGEYSYLMTTVVLTIFWSVANTLYKKRTLFYLIPLSFIGIMAFLSSYPYVTSSFVVTLLYSIGMLLIIHRIKWDFLAAVPVLFIYLGTLQFLIYQSLGATNEFLLLVVIGLGFLLTGKGIYKNLYNDSSSIFRKSVDVYTIGAVLSFATIYGFEQAALWTRVLPGLLIAFAIWIQKRRIPKTFEWIPSFLAGGYLLEPYYALVTELEIPSLLQKEVEVLPYIVLGIYLRICLKGKYESLTNRIQWIILLVVSLFLVLDGLESSTIYDALILGTLSLLSILGGVIRRIKSYFLVGTGVLLLNVLLQTRPFWGNLPWWAYLLIAGSILIGVASFNEWQKQKGSRGETTLFVKVKKRIKERFKKWN